MELTEQEIGDFKKPNTEFIDFPEDLIRLMERYSPISSQSLKESFSKLEMQFEEIKKDLSNREIWFKKFQESLDKQEESIVGILTGLKEEVSSRKLSISEFKIEYKDSLSDYAKQAYKTAAIVGTIGAVVMSFLIWLLKWLLSNGV